MSTDDSAEIAEQLTRLLVELESLRAMTDKAISRLAEILARVAPDPVAVEPPAQ